MGETHHQDNAGPKFALNMCHSAGGRRGVQARVGYLDTPYHTAGVRLGDGSVVLAKNAWAKQLTGARGVTRAEIEVVEAGTEAEAEAEVDGGGGGATAAVWGYTIDGSVPADTTVGELRKLAGL